MLQSLDVEVQDVSPDLSQCLEKPHVPNSPIIKLEECLANYCWKRDQFNTLLIGRKESKES
ncbi:hypothetical protein DMB84_011510 [Pectobacterium aquaticum]|uniref:Uncharacterized protein n=1 Tax=Pectobacterium aquaticum TaxID=2204145 RepID=A0AA93ALK7_9GAMM|nr:hypothetical protein F164LOC_04415 [Pectobacterium carotovorum]RRN98642.1 hypothetical protein DMB83_019105 [Pectobacterium aquaticum]TAI97388.1 hypothetical protein EG332_10460 [Pectobacterium versatile]RRO00267.1 hypothetical protein DMB79_000250 [Pectobacterium aquaticum]RRO04921.1 hypothetical protein DMB81_016080 [Pectobacterium aquaticum]